MIGPVVTINGRPTDILPGSAEKLGKAVAQYVTRELRPAFQRDINQQLWGKEPGSPKYPIRWASEKQRKYVMAKLRKDGNLPYKRTHALARGWKTTVKIEAMNGSIEVSHPWDKAGFVVGQDQQPFHQDTGWLQTSGANGFFAKERDRLEDQLMAAWPEILAESVK